MSSYNELYEIIMEKKSREKYRMSKFKKQHSFIPDYNKDAFGNIGTILVDGKRVPADLDIHSKVADTGDSIIGRQTSALISGDNQGEIILDKDTFNLKNPKRMNAMVNHEIGHLKMHSIQKDAVLRDPRFVSSANINQLLDTHVGSFIASGLLQPSDRRNVKKELLKEIDVKGYLKTGTPDKQNRQIRNACWKIAQKYAKSRNLHSNPQEFEADRYAANRSGEKQLKRGLREYTKRYGRTTQNNLKRAYATANVPAASLKPQISALNNMLNDDLKNRTRALKDKDLRNSKLYK